MIPGCYRSLWPTPTSRRSADYTVRCGSIQGLPHDAGWFGKREEIHTTTAYGGVVGQAGHGGIGGAFHTLA